MEEESFQQGESCQRKFTKKQAQMYKNKSLTFTLNICLWLYDDNQSALRILVDFHFSPQITK